MKADIELQIAELQAERSKLSEKKMEIQRDLSLLSGCGLSSKAQRTMKVNLLTDCERKLAGLKRRLSQLHVEKAKIGHAEKLERTHSQESRLVTELKEKLGAELRKNFELHQRVTAQDCEIIRLNRQLDAAIREINLIPKVVRAVHIQEGT